MCVYAQQGYAFGHVSLCFCIYVTQKLAVWGLTAWKSPVSVIYCSLVDAKKGAYYTRWFVQGKTFLLTGWEKGSWKLYYGQLHLIYMQNAASYAMLFVFRTACQHATAVQTYNATTGKNFQIRKFSCSFGGSWTPGSMYVPSCAVCFSC